MKKFVKLLSIILCVTMVITALPFAVTAESGTEEPHVHTVGRVEIIQPTDETEGKKITRCKTCYKPYLTETIEKLPGRVVANLSSNENTFLTGVMKKDYSASITVPHGMIIDTSSVTSKLTLTNISSLGITEPKTHENIIPTGVQKEINLDNYLPSFNSATIKGKINNVPYEYNLKGTDSEDKFSVDITPSSEEEARTAFNELKSGFVEFWCYDVDATNIEIDSGTSVQIGTEKLVVDKAIKICNLTSNNISLQDISKIIRENSHLEEAEELEDAQIEIIIPASNIFEISNISLALVDTTTIKIYGYEDSADINTILSKLRDCKTNEEILKTTALFIGDFISAIDNRTLTVDVEYECVPDGEWVITQEPTCKNVGWKVQHCLLCENVAKRERIPKLLGCQYTEIERVEPKDCTEVGYVKSVCSTCNEVFVDKYIGPHTEGDWEVFIQPTATQDGLKRKYCTLCGRVLAEEIIPKLETVVSGTVKTFDVGTETSDLLKMEFVSDETNIPLFVKSFEGSGVINFEYADITPGTYTVKISKQNHVTREYEIEIKEGDNNFDFEIYLVGDITGDGKVGMRDLVMINSHIKETSLLTDYAFTCADINGDSKINMQDMTKINSHVKEIKYLW